MFRRLILEDTAAWFTLVAFITAVSIFVTIAFRALRMQRTQVAKFENLPFDVATPVARGVSPATPPGAGAGAEVASDLNASRASRRGLQD